MRITKKRKKKRKKKEKPTKYIDPKLSIDWRKEPIHKMNEPPGNIESNRNREQDNTEKKTTKIQFSNNNNKL